MCAGQEVGEPRPGIALEALNLSVTQDRASSKVMMSVRGAEGSGVRGRGGRPAGGWGGTGKGLTAGGAEVTGKGSACREDWDAGGRGSASKITSVGAAANLCFLLACPGAKALAGLRGLSHPLLLEELGEPKCRPRVKSFCLFARRRSTLV